MTAAPDDMPSRRQLTCGPAQITLEDGQLRHLRLNGHEAIRGIALLVRDRDWGTVAPRITDLTITETDPCCTVTYLADYAMGGHLRARVSLILTPDTLTATVAGMVAGEVWTNRAGFTVLHPIDGVAGMPVLVDHPDHTQTRARFPGLIAPWQPFQDIAALTHSCGPWQVVCQLTGDVFEMEDQRQWGDASFKTYNRPLALPWPYRLADGARLDQTVTIRWQPQPQMRTDAPAWTMPTAPHFPQTALLMTGGDAVRAVADPRHLRRIAPQRVLCHLDATAGDLLAPDLSAFATLQAVCPDLAFDLELIAVCPPGGDLDAEFAAHADAVGLSGLRTASIMVTPAVDRQSVPPGSDWPDCPPLDDILAAARRAFPGLTLGGGTASFFPELNRKRPPVARLDFITHGLCPIVHAADDLSVMETLQAVPHILASGRAIAQGVDYRLGPSTIAMRQNPYGSRTIPNPDRRRICMADDDPRQDGDFAAVWTCGLAAALAPAGLTVWTPAALYGPRGLVDDDDRMRPVCHVVAALAAQAGMPVHRATVQDGTATLHVGDDVLTANLSGDGFGWRLDRACDLSLAGAPPKA